MLRITILLLIPFNFFSKIPSTNKFEKKWAFWHPFAALKIKKIYKKAMPFYQDAFIKTELDVFESGGKLDAFRHIFFMAAFSQKIKIKKVRKLGLAHEKGNFREFLKSKNEEGERLDSIGTEMDLKNNELGFKLSENNSVKKMSLSDLKKLVISEIKTGKAFILKRNSAGKYVDCENTVIDFEKFKTIWATPRCLIPSA